MFQLASQCQINHTFSAQLAAKHHGNQNSNPKLQTDCVILKIIRIPDDYVVKHLTLYLRKKEHKEVTV